MVTPQSPALVKNHTCYSSGNPHRRVFNHPSCVPVSIRVLRSPCMHLSLFILGALLNFKKANFRDSQLQNTLFLWETVLPQFAGLCKEGGRMTVRQFRVYVKTADSWHPSLLSSVPVTFSYSWEQQRMLAPRVFLVIQGILRHNGITHEIPPYSATCAPLSQAHCPLYQTSRSSGFACHCLYYFVAVSYKQDSFLATVPVAFSSPCQHSAPPNLQNLATFLLLDLQFLFFQTYNSFFGDVQNDLITIWLCLKDETSSGSPHSSAILTVPVDWHFQYFSILAM